MKLLTSILTLLTLASSAVSADDSFTIIRDGREYLCRPSGPTDPGKAGQCAEKAYQGPFSREESIEICEGALDTGPADCALEAYRGPFSKQQAIQLCKRSTTQNGPALCAKKAYSGPFSREESITLCSRSGTEAHADCAKKAYSGPYSKEEAIKLCKASPFAILKTLDAINAVPGLATQLRVMKLKENK